MVRKPRTYSVLSAITAWFIILAKPVDFFSQENVKQTTDPNDVGTSFFYQKVLTAEKTY